jgi:acetate---CoA ligase (ADP-forming) subunit beta
MKNTDLAERIFCLAKERNSQIIPEFYSKDILTSSGIPTPKQGLAGSELEAVAIANQIGYPVVLKVHSFEITHKSDVKGVLLNVKSDEEVRSGYREMIRNIQVHHPYTDDVMVSVQQMLKPGLEIIVGMRRDKVFGPSILFGLGGVWVEVLKDVSLRVAPLKERDMDEMINEIKGSPLLGEFRGSLARDLPKLKELMLMLEELAFTYPEISEVDLNPVFLHEDGKGAIVADARIILSSEYVLVNGGDDS